LIVVESARGPLPLERLGRTLVDEHVLVGLFGHERWESAESAMEAARDVVVTALRGLREGGIDTIVDTTVAGAGRLPCFQTEVSEASGLNIIACTGFPAAAAGVPEALRLLDPTRLADLLIRELSDALPGSQQKAAVISVSAVGAAEEFDLNALKAAAFAYAETGAPVFARSGLELGDWQAEGLMARGVDPERILVSGLDGPATTFAGLDRLAKLGVNLGFTNIGRTDGLDEDATAAIVGYAIRRFGPERVCISMGSWAYWLAAVGLPPAPAVDARRGFGALDGFLGRLEGWGIDRSQVSDLLTRGPRRLFGG
jgi:phosphotriesterase-related protein